MTFTLIGRIQTRIFLGITVGVIWTAVITPFLPSPPMGSLGGVGMVPMQMTRLMLPLVAPYNPLAIDYRMTFAMLGIMVAAGVLWECIYHFMQQFRWNKDWPAFFVLLAGIPEGLVLWYLVHFAHVENGPLALNSPGMPMFAIDFITVWLLMWLFMTGPMKVVSMRWRFEGGRLL